MTNHRSRHMDIKPENIMILGSDTKSPYDWKWKLTDLGPSHFKSLPNVKGEMAEGENINGMCKFL